MKTEKNIRVQDVTIQDARILKEQAMLQSQFFFRLKKWLPRLTGSSAVFLILIVYGKTVAPFISITGWIGMVLSLSLLLLSGLALHHGKQNLDRIFRLLDGLKSEDNALSAKTEVRS